MVDDLTNLAAPSSSQEMIDIVFDVDGTLVPNDYQFMLWPAIVDFLPWLIDVENAGILPLRGSTSGEHTLLSKRTKLILRLPVAHADKAFMLIGKRLPIGGSTLVIGNGKQRPLIPAPTLYAYMVESELEEVKFLADTQEKLKLMGIPCNLICDKHRTVSSTIKTLRGFGLVLHDLKPLASLQIQRLGLGGSRHFGCGIFIPFKVISGLDS